LSTLITGADGFVGQWLIRALLERGDVVFGTTLSAEPNTSVLSADERKKVAWIQADVRDGDALVAAVDRSNADKFYHLAGVAFVPSAKKDPVPAFDVNVLGLARLVAAIVGRKKSAANPIRILAIGSGEQYGRHESAEYPLGESAEQRPLSIYAATKAAQEIVALQAARSGDVEVVATRSFNHSGVGQDSGFLLPGLVERVRSASKAKRPTFPIGNTSPVRDFLHVTDVVSAYIALMDQGRSGEVYNVASGNGHSVQQLIDLTLEVARTDAVAMPDPALVRAAEIPISIGDPAKLRRETAWSPAKTAHHIVSDLWNAHV